MGKDMGKDSGNDTMEEFKPYVSDKESPKELTATSIIIGILLAVIFGAANAYLGLRVGLTVSASIPAAVMSMGIIRIFLKRNSILESNIVQTIGSAGESLAAGVIFTVPALFLWAAEGKAGEPGFFDISLLALCGGILGVLFMIPLRNVLVVREHGVLPYPEGTACAEVLLAGEKGGSSANRVFWGVGLSAALKFIIDGLKVVPGVIAVPIKALKTELSTEAYPALISVGYISGPRISAYMLSGGLLGWFVLIPAIIFFGGENTLFPGTESINAMYESGGASAIWGSYIRYIGAGMVAAGGLNSLVKSMPMIISTFVEVMKGVIGQGRASSRRTETDMDLRLVLCGAAVIVLLIWILPQIPVSLPGALMIVLFGFFFGTVSSRIVGIVGSSNNPVSGMTIATLLVSASILKEGGNNGSHGMVGAMAIGSIICIITAISGDTSQDLKTGYLLGATPKKQQIGELIGTIFSALTIGGVLVLLNMAWGFGSKELAAPQASLMKMIVEGVMDGNLPWDLILIGVFIAVAIEILGVPVLPVAIGLYLPLELSTAIGIGGLVRLFADRGTKKEENNGASGGLLFCSGLIAGEGIIGIILALLTVVGIAPLMDLSGIFSTGPMGSLALIAIFVVTIYRMSVRNGK